MPSFSIFFIAIFLLFTALSLIPYLIKLSGQDPSQNILSPTAFILTSLAIISSTLLFTLLLGASNLLLAAALAIGIVLSLFHPVSAICFFVAVLFLRPWEYLPDNQFLLVLPRSMAALTLLSWILHAIRTGRTKIVWNSSCWIFSFFMIWLSIGALFTGKLLESLQFIFTSFSPIAVLCFLILNSLLSTDDLKLFGSTLTLSILGVVTTAISITLNDYATDPSLFRLHGFGLWGNANDLAALIVFALPLSLSPLLFNQLGSKLFATITSSILLIALLWTQSRAAQSSIVIAGLCYLIFCKTSIKAATIWAIVIAFASLIYSAMPSREIEDLAGSTTSRASYLVAGIKMAKSHPLFGVGVNNYSNLYERYTPSFAEWGNRTAHSSWILALAESGLVGLLLFISLYISALRQAWHIRKIAPELFLIMITYGIAMTFLSHTYLFLPYVMMSFIISGARAKLNKSSELAVMHAPLCSYFGLGKKQTLAYRAALFVLFLFMPIGNSAAQELSALSAVRGIEKPIGNNRTPETKDTLELKGSRAETLNFLIKSKGHGCFPVTLTNLESKSPGEFRFYSLPEIRTAHPSYPGAFVGKYLDPVVPLPEPVSLCLKKDSETTWFLGELKIPSNSAPGNFITEIRAGDQKLQIKTTIWKMLIPEKPSMPAYAEMTPWFNLLGHYGKWNNDEAALSQAYITSMADHRVYPLKSTIAPLEISSNGANAASLDIDTKPSAESSFRSIVLKQRPGWAYYDFPTVGSSGFEKIDYNKAENYFRAVENTIKKINRPLKALVYLWDEPQSDAISELTKLSKNVKSWAPSLKQLVTTTYLPALKDSVDIFAPVINQFDSADFPSTALYKQFQKEGHEVWWYVSCMSHGCEALADSGVPDLVIDRPSAYIRSVGWLSMRYQIDAFLYYSVNNGFQFNPKRDPWKSPWDFSGNGDGTLFYPGRPGEHGLNAHQPIPSLRLKLWRETSYDAEYINWANQSNQKPLWWEKEFMSLARSTTNWSKDYIKYQVLRDRIGDFLNLQTGEK